MKLNIDGIKKKIDANGKVMTKKSSSHGTWRAKRKPNSKESEEWHGSDLIKKIKLN